MVPRRYPEISMNLQIRHTILAISIAIVCAGLAGCGEELSCSAHETRQLVDQIAMDEAKRGGALEPDRPTMTLSMSDIITTDKQKTKTSCKAKLTVTFTLRGSTEPPRSSDLSISYTVERTDDGRLYVTVQGI